ncbi:MAG TPA: UbiH/UbiF family hydroxylase [Methylophilaceae bacterium]|jgi:ubiquinone biosynthesis UbiH/UbiF/VisC/COQ6 family hydroxylase
MTKTFDVVIVGGGLVGSVLALALGKRGVRSALIETSMAEHSTDEWDSRIYAVTPANAEFLRDLGVWDVLESARITAVHAMQIWGDNSASPLTFDAYGAGVAELSWIAEGRLMQSAILNALRATPEVDIICPARCTDLKWASDIATLKLEDSMELTAKLVVAADGANSWVRQQAGIKVEKKSYFQQGVVANFTISLPHQHIARQWFKREGVLAWLPLPGQRISMVWSLFDEQANNLLKLEAGAFCETVAEAGQYALGTLQLITPPVAFPLALQRSAALIAPRLALVGDAAHLVHPLAGQGMNLGLRDVQSLTDIIGESGADAGNWLSLRRYERARKADILAMQTVTNGLQKLFNNDNPMLAWVRNTGLNAVDKVSPLKRLLIAQAVA